MVLCAGLHLFFVLFIGEVAAVVVASSVGMDGGYLRSTVCLSSHYPEDIYPNLQAGGYVHGVIIVYCGKHRLGHDDRNIYEHEKEIGRNRGEEHEKGD